ncbi:phosphoenolpyruvate--protein phosphotransferase [Thiovibrio sp. JS02]
MTNNHSRTIYGIGASPGIVIGPVLYLGRRKSGRRGHRLLGDGEVETELARFREATARAEAQLVAVRATFNGNLAGYASIIDSHILMLRDRMLHGRALAIIAEDRHDAEWALEEALAEARQAFARIEDQYLRERVHDVEQVAERIFRCLAGDEEQRFAGTGERHIVAAQDFAPEDILRMAADKVQGFFTEKGGETSHNAIVARTLGIPSVVGADDALRQVVTGELAILDGGSGRIILRPSPEQIAQYREYQRQQRQYGEQVALYTHLAAETRDGMRLTIEANLEMAEEAPQALSYGAAGIGLFRSEYYYLGKKELPGEEALFEVYRGLLSRLSPFPVTIRTLDAGGDKLMAGVGSVGETNPALGLRAIRFSLREPEIFKVQLRALLRAGVHGKLRIMFPMIASLCEMKRIKALLAEVKEELIKEGIAFAGETPIGIMVEVPSAVSIADVLAREVDFFSIGTNDLIQYALAIDRGNEHVAHMYEPLHPAVLRMIRQVVEAGHQAGIEVGLCGEMAGEISYVPLLLGLGLDQLSMHPLAIPFVKRMVRNTMAEEAEGLCAQLLACVSAQEVHTVLADYLSRHYPEEFGIGGIGHLRKSCCTVLSGDGQNPTPQG